MRCIKFPPEAQNYLFSLSLFSAKGVKNKYVQVFSAENVRARYAFPEERSGD